MGPRPHDPIDSENKPKSSWGWRALNIIPQGFIWLFRKLWSVVSRLFFRSSSQETQQSAHESKSELSLSVSETTVTADHIATNSSRSPQLMPPAITHNKAIVRLSAETKTESKGAYVLYLLDNNSPALLEQVKQRGGNAVLLYPGSINPSSSSSSSSGSREYKACFIQNGKVQYLPSPGTQSQQLREISIGKQIISRSKIPHPNATNLTNAALARAGIVIAPILTVPKEVLPPSMDTQSLVSYARSSFLAHQLTQDQVNQRAVEILFMHISEGEISQVKKMLDKNPELALLQWNSKTTSIHNKGGQRIYVQGKTGYEFAVGEEDTEIAALFKAAIIKVKGEVEGQEKANELFYKQRPPGWEEEEAKRYAPTFVQAHKLAEAIRDGAADITSSGEPDYIVTVEEKSTTASELAAYRKSLNDRRNEVVTTGRHYNLNLPQELLQLYNDHYEDYFGGRWNDPRAMLFWQQSIGGEQQGMTANMAQAYCDGLFNTAQKLQEEKPQGRSLKFEKYDSTSRRWGVMDLYPGGRVDSDLGFKFAIAPVGGSGWCLGCGHESPPGAVAAGGWAAWAWPLPSLCQSKKAGLQKLTQHHDHRSFCSVM